MNITVYLGAETRARESALKTAVCGFGTWIEEHAHTLVYGGSRVWSDGCGRGVSTLAAGGKGNRRRAALLSRGLQLTV